MDFQKDKIDLNEIDFWQQRCNDFWNLFYSYLILNQYNINILNLNFYTGESGTGESGTDSFVNKLKVQEETIQNDCINLLLQKQQFEINNQYYEIPQNFLGIEFCETNSLIQILFYYFDEKEQTDNPEIKKYYKITEDATPQVEKIYYVLSDGKYNEAVLVGDPAEFKEEDKPYYEQIQIYGNYFNPFNINISSGGES